MIQFWTILDSIDAFYIICYVWKFYFQQNAKDGQQQNCNQKIAFGDHSNL